MTEIERSEGLSYEWVSVDDAIRAMAEVQLTLQMDNFIKERDLSFVETYVSQMAQSE